MIETKIIVKPKGNSETGNSSGAAGYGGEYVSEADYAARAGKAKKAESADLAMRANTANTADRAKYADKAGELDEEAEVLQRYIRKDIDDIAQGTVTWEKVQKLLGGLLVGEDFSFDADGNIIAHSIASENANEAEHKGFSIIQTGPKTGKYKLNINELLAFSKAKVGDKFVFDAANDFRFDAGGNIIAHSIASENANTDEGKGFIIARIDETGKYKLCIDELLAWGLATMKQLHVKGDSTFDGNLFSKEFISGFLGGKGWGIYNKPITNTAGMQENKWTGELDNLIVRGSLRVYEMIISQLLGENDNRIFAGMMEVDHYDPETGKVYFDTQGGKLYNPFRKDDCIMVQQYNGMPNSSNDYYVTKNYELVITEAGCGSTADGENRLDWVKFDSFTSSIEGATPDKLIKKKDTFVRVDNLSDPDRKGIMQIITVGTAAPYLDILYGMKTDPEDCLKGRLGNLEGIHHRTFGDLTGFGELLQNLYATGDLVLRRTGESIDTKFQMLQNQFATRFAQTTYELTNEDNYIHNGTFLTATGKDSDSLIIDGWEIDETDESAIWICGGMPVMVNGQVTASGNRRVLIEATEGRNMLRIINCGLKQVNALIRQPGTHKEYNKPSGTKTDEGMGVTADGYTEVQDTLYISARVYAKTAGTMTIGFSPNTAVEGKKNELAAQSVNIAYSGEWQFIKLEGKWNGRGDFVIRYTGDMLLSFLAMTDKPIDNLQKTVSTQILQTASNIKLLGENIDKVNGRTTQLGIELDAEKKSIRAYVDEQDKALDKSFRSEISMTKNKIMASVTEKDKALETELSSRINIQAGRIDILNSWQTSTEKRMSSIETSIDSIKLEVSSVKDTAGKTSAALAKLTITVDGISTAVGKAATKKELSAAQDALSSEIDSNDKEVRKYIDGIDSGIRSDYGTTVSLVKQKSDSWSVAAGAFYSDGTLRECGGLSVSTYFTNLFNKKITLDASGNVKNISKSGLLVTADKTALETKISNVDGKIISSATIETMISNGISKASIRADQISLEGVVTANKYFKINTDGSMETIAGKIAGMKISGDGLNNEGFDNDAYIVLRNDTHKVFAGIGGNVLPASTGARAVARFTNEESSKFFGDVNYSVVCGAKGAVTNVALDMTLGGYITGLRIKTARLSSGGSSYGSPVAIPKGTNSVILGGSGYYQLPSMSKEDDGYVVFIKNDYDGAVHLRSNTSVTSKGLIRTSFILYNKGSNTTDLVIDSRGDAMIFVYHRDVNIAGEENTKVGCWTQYKCPRDW
nr:MAG TPA: tail protein [Caudoviricetes sp.]